MGSRGAFVDVDMNNFMFVENGQLYYSIGSLNSNSNVKVLIQKDGSVKAPEFSHTANRIYAIVQNGALKHLAYYDSHNQHICIDFLHAHKGVMPHVHINLEHSKNAPGLSPTKEQLELAKKIKKEFHLK